MPNGKPGAGNAGHQNIVISNWKLYTKGSLCGFFTATMPSGVIYHSLMLHQKNDSRWISFPAKEWVNERGEKQYSRFVEFIDRRAADRFRDQVLLALDEHLESLS
jgi:hypothetical protein